MAFVLANEISVAKGAFIWKKNLTLIIKVKVIVWYVTNASRSTWDEQHNGMRLNNFSNVYLGLLRCT